MTDLLGGTPTNLSLSFLTEEHIAVVTGVNISMLLTLSSYRRQKSLKQIGVLLRKAGRRNITLAKNVGEIEKKEKWIRWYAHFERT